MPTPKIDSSQDDRRRRLTPVYTLLEDARVQELAEQYSRPVVLEALQDTMAAYRQDLGPSDPLPELDEIVGRVSSHLAATDHERLRPVVNGTGILLHTGLGRAVLPQEAVDALAGMNRCCNLQVDLVTGERGRRNFVTEHLLCKLTGAEAAVVVTNNAGATFLILSTFCEGREVIVSRSQQVEIGGSFRLPHCIRQSGAILAEIGTTNRTHLRDYEEALSERTGMILRVKPSNYRVVGFTKEVSIGELATLKGRDGSDALLVDDLGSGALVDLTQFGLPAETTVPESIADGADLACFSGDKLIGGPQAGIIVGRKELIAKIRRHPLTRMFRVGKLTDLALEQTLRLFLKPETLVERHPTYRMLAAQPEALRRQAQTLKRRIDRFELPYTVGVRKDASAIGGGSLPTVDLETSVLTISSPGVDPARLAFLLRQHEPPIVGRLSGGEVCLDMRTLLPGDDKAIVEALQRIGGLVQQERPSSARPEGSDA